MKPIVAVALALALPAPAAAAPTAKQVGKLVAPERRPDDRFGAALAVDGARGVVSSPDGDVGIHDAAGRLHALAFTGGTWTVAGDIDAGPGAGPGRRLGFHAAIAGDTAIVGAPGYFNGGNFAGAFYSLAPDTWTPAAVIGPPQPAVDTNFGLRVAAAPGRALASRFQTGNEPAGRVYAFVADGPGEWDLTQTIEAPDPAPGDRFGLAMAVAGDQVLIGAPGADMARGAAYLFQWTDQGWAFAAKLVAPQRKPDDRFGAAVAVDGGVALVGAPGSAKDTGAAWMFELEADTWVARPPLLPTGLVPRGQYGYAVALDLPYAIVTAVDHDLAPANPEAGGRGRASWFGRAGDGAWLELAAIEAADGVPGDRLGFSVALAGDHVLLGAPGDDDDLGSVYVFRLALQHGSPCVGDPECQAGVCCDGVCAESCESATGSSGDVTTGASDTGDGSITAGLPPLDLDPAAGDGCSCSSRHGGSGSPWIFLVVIPIAVTLRRPRRHV